MRRIIFNALIVSLLTLTGCLGSAPLSIKTTSEVMINKTLSAIYLVKSYQLSSDFTENGFLDNGGTEWMGTKLVNVSDKEIRTNMLITTGPLSTYTEIYCKDGLEYCKTISEESIPQTTGWTQAKLTDDVWNQQAQISFLAELLKTATQSSSLKIEMLNGVNYYTLSITPSPQASVDWVLSQAQPGGPSFFSIEGGFFVRPDTYHEGSVKLWIDQSNDLPRRVEVEFDFQGEANGGPSSTAMADQRYNGQLVFSDYNQQISISLPQEALDIHNGGN